MANISLEQETKELISILEFWNENAHFDVRRLFNPKSITDIIDLIFNVPEINNKNHLSEIVADIWLKRFFRENNSMKSKIEIRNLLRTVSEEKHSTVISILEALYKISFKMLPLKYNEMSQLTKEGSGNAHFEYELLKIIIETVVNTLKRETRKVNKEFYKVPDFEKLEKEFEESARKKERAGKIPTFKPSKEGVQKEVGKTYETYSSLESKMSKEQKQLKPKGSLSGESDAVSISSGPVMFEEEEEIDELESKRLIEELPPYYKILQNWNERAPIDVAVYLGRKSVSHSIKLTSLLPENENKQYLIPMLATLFHTNHLQRLPFECIEGCLTNIALKKSEKMRRIVPVIYNHLLGLSKSSLFIQQRAMIEERAQGKLLSVSQLQMEFERNKLLTSTIEDLINTIQWDDVEFEPIENDIDLETILNLAEKGFGNTIIVQVYNKYNKLLDSKENPFVDSKYKDSFKYASQERILALVHEISLYKPGDIAINIMYKLKEWGNKPLDLEFGTFLFNIIAEDLAIPVSPQSNYHNIVREIVQGTMRVAKQLEWDIETIVKHLTIGIMVMSYIENPYQIEFIAYQTAQEIIAGAKNVKYKKEMAASGIGKATVSIMLHGIADPSLSILADMDNYQQMTSMYCQGIWDTIIEITNSPEEAQNTSNIFMKAIEEENERILQEKRKNDIKKYIPFFK